VKAPAGATRVDGTGKFLMPGLAEMHGHLTASYLTDEARADVLYLYVANGVTTVRAMLGNPEAITTRDAIAAGKLLGPKLYVAGPVLNGKIAPTPEDGARVVREQKQAGYDLLKILGGMPPAAYDSIMRTAHSLKIDVAGHVPAEVGVRDALAARQRSIDHLDRYIPALQLTPDTTREEEDRRIAELAQLTVKSGVWNVPTMYLWDLFHNAETGEMLRTRLIETRFLPRKLMSGPRARTAVCARRTIHRRASARSAGRASASWSCAARYSEHSKRQTRRSRLAPTRRRWLTHIEMQKRLDEIATRAAGM
jgi:hypothetical protein